MRQEIETVVPTNGTGGTEGESMYGELRAVAKEVYRELQDVGSLARAELVRRIRRERLVGLALEHDAHILLHEQMRGRRGVRARMDRMERSAATREGDGEEDLPAVASVGAWPLRSGTPLRDATIEEVATQAELHRANERGNRLAAEFHEAIVAEAHQRGLHLASHVREGMSDEDLMSIYRSVYGAQEGVSHGA